MEELEDSEKKKVEEAVRLLRSVTGSTEISEPSSSASTPTPRPLRRTGLTDEGNEIFNMLGTSIVADLPLLRATIAFGCV